MLMFYFVYENFGSSEIPFFRSFKHGNAIFINIFNTHPIGTQDRVLIFLAFIGRDLPCAPWHNIRHISSKKSCYNLQYIVVLFYILMRVSLCTGIFIASRRKTMNWLIRGICLPAKVVLFVSKTESAQFKSSFGFGFWLFKCFTLLLVRLFFSYFLVIEL